MKKILITIVILFGLFLAINLVTGPYSSTATILLIEEKGQSADREEYWINAFNPYSETKEMIKIKVEDMMVWNLIEEDREYFVTFGTEGDDPIELMSIEHPHKDTDQGSTTWTR